MDEISEVIKGARAAQVGRIYGSFSNVQQVSSDDDLIQKIKELEENPFEKGGIGSAFNSSNSLKITKTGKEIKDQLSSTVMPELEAELIAVKSEMDDKLAECGSAPTQNPDEWDTNGIKLDVGYKKYKYGEVYCKRSDESIFDSFTAEDALAKKGNCPENLAQEEARGCYNTCFNKLCDLMVEKKTCGLLFNGLKDEENYELTSNQLLSLRF